MVIKGSAFAADVWQNAVLLVDKPPGWTSFDVCGRLRGALKVKKVRGLLLQRCLRILGTGRAHSTSGCKGHKICRAQVVSPAVPGSATPGVRRWACCMTWISAAADIRGTGAACRWLLQAMW